MILWPAIIKYEGESELTFVDSASEWESDVDLHCFSYEEGDRLVDSTGGMYTLNQSVANCVKPEATGLSFDKDEILEMIKEHFSSIGECCVSKFGIKTIAEGIRFVGTVDQ